MTQRLPVTASTVCLLLAVAAVLGGCGAMTMTSKTNKAVTVESVPS